MSIVTDTYFPLPYHVRVEPSAKGHHNGSGNFTRNFATYEDANDYAIYAVKNYEAEVTISFMQAILREEEK